MLPTREDERDAGGEGHDAGPLARARAARGSARIARRARARGRSRGAARRSVAARTPAAAARRAAGGGASVGGGVRRPRLRLREPMGELLASSAARRARGGGARVGGLGDRADDGDPARARREDRADVAPRRCRRSRRTGPSRARRRGGRARGRRRRGRASSASRRRGRRRCSRRRRPRRSPRANASSGRRAPAGPPSARARAAPMSSWPTWQPSAPAAATRSGRSLRISSAPASSQSRAGDRRGGEQLVVGGRLVAQLDDVDAAGEGRAEDVGERAAAGPRVADEVQRGALQPGAAVVEIGHDGHCRNARRAADAGALGLRSNGSP